jgi:hypothetical protein
METIKNKIMDGIIDTFYAVHANDMGYIIDWMDEQSNIMDSIGWYYTTQISIGKPQLDDWGLDIVKHGKVHGEIIVFESEDAKNEYENQIN